MVEVTLHIPFVPLQMSLLKRRILGQRLFAVPHAMRFHIGFGNHIQAVFIA